MQPPTSQEVPHRRPAVEEARTAVLAVVAHRPPHNLAAAVHPVTTAGAVAILCLEVMEVQRLPLRMLPAVPTHPVHPLMVATPLAAAVPHRPRARQNPQVRARWSVLPQEAQEQQRERRLPVLLAARSVVSLVLSPATLPDRRPTIPRAVPMQAQARATEERATRVHPRHQARRRHPHRLPHRALPTEAIPPLPHRLPRVRVLEQETLRHRHRLHLPLAVPHPLAERHHRSPLETVQPRRKRIHRTSSRSSLPFPTRSPARCSSRTPFRARPGRTVR